MRAQVRVTPDGDDFIVRLASSQALVAGSVLEALRSASRTDAALMVRVGFGHAEVEALIRRLRALRGAPEDLRLRPEELHALHSALLAAPTLFLVKGRHFSEEPFHNMVGVFRENVDALALHLAEAAEQSAGQAPGTA
ncbi:hypothetical protein [Streptomyces sp. ODS05-4]|uniref:hypothetical protein n=1 Tax=Streptomyces sp. ODS05-4 TaxID=2944939 RepID=UPI002108D7E0|nr:hypothetical protein [Streptomyces sp. ODS05-4]